MGIAQTEAAAARGFDLGAFCPRHYGIFLQAATSTEVLSCNGATSWSGCGAWAGATQSPQRPPLSLGDSSCFHEPALAVEAGSPLRGGCSAGAVRVERQPVGIRNDGVVLISSTGLCASLMRGACPAGMRNRSYRARSALMKRGTSSSVPFSKLSVSARSGFAGSISSLNPVYDRPGCRVEDIVSLLLSQYSPKFLRIYSRFAGGTGSKICRRRSCRGSQCGSKFVAVCVVARTCRATCSPPPEHHHVERHFEHLAAAAEDQHFPVRSLERPCVIGHVVGQCADVFARSIIPTPRFEPRPDAGSRLRRGSRPRHGVIAIGPGDLPSARRRLCRCPQQLPSCGGFSTTQSTK